jgi:hypothetical protein
MEKWRNGEMEKWIALPGACEMRCEQWVFWAPTSHRELMNRTLEVGAIGTDEEKGKRGDRGSGASDIPRP